VTPREHHVRIDSPDGTGATTQVTIDGHPAHLQALELRMSGDTANDLRIAIPLPRVEYEGRAKVQLDAATEALLIVMGWTPPRRDG
jgi:hypothetical protein